MAKIPVTIGVLTYNSGKTLARALESVKECAEIIISDGGSTDDTLLIAKRYDARVISQSNPGTPIVDFALERNRLLDAATHDWFFYLDSDEVASEDLIKAMRKATEDPSGSKVYQVRYQLTSPDLLIKYKTAVPYYQPRFFHTRTGGRFIKKVHEKVWWEHGPRPKEGRIEGPWYVPLDVQLRFSVYRAKVHHRLPLIARESRQRGSLAWVIRKGFVEPLWTTVKSLLKLVYLRARYIRSWSELVPLRYEFYRMYSHIYMSKLVWGEYLRTKKTFRALVKLVKNENPLIVRQTSEKWEQQFARGKWDFLLDAPPNIVVIAGLVRESLIPGKKLRVLDVGCGNGSIPKLLAKDADRLDYTGIDISPSAIGRAKGEFPTGKFIVGDIERPDGLSGTYDIIIFAEVLLYIDYARIAERYARFASPKTLVIISLYRTIRTQLMWMSIARWFTESMRRNVSGEKNSWRIKIGVFRETFS